MPYCPECGYEYVAGITECPDCRASLVEGEQFFCDNCEEPVSAGAAFCSGCGVVLDWAAEKTAPLKCPVHPEAEAVGRCVLCRKLVCEQCAVMKRGKYFCADDRHVEMAFDWVSVYTTGTEYEAEMVAANLVSAGIPARVYVQSDQMFVTTMGDLAVTRVMVPSEAVAEARAFLATLPSPPAEGE